MTGLRKAAILMVGLGPKRAAELLAKCELPQRDVERLAAEIARMTAVDAAVRQAVVNEFARSLASGPETKAGPAFAKEMLASVLGPDRTADILEGLESRASGRSFLSLCDLDTKRLVELLRDEQPQVIAIAMRFLPREKAAEVLSALPDDLRMQAVMRLVKAGDPAPEALELVAKALWAKAASLANWEGSASSQQAKGGPRTLVEILNQADLAVENAVLDSLAALDPELGEQVRESMFIFADLPRLDARALQLVLRGVEPADLAVAMKGASEEVRKVVFDNLSENAAAGLKEDLEALGPVPRRDVYAAQQKIVTAVRALGEEGKINLRFTEEAAEEMVA